MAEHASRGFERSGARTKARGPEPAREKSPEELERETVRRKDIAERTITQAQTAVAEAKAAFDERDVESFDEAKSRAKARLTHAQLNVLSLREHTREVETEAAKEQLAAVESKTKELKRSLEALERPEPLPEPFANEALIQSAIPAGRVDNAHLVFAAAETRLVGLLRALPAKDRGIFLARIKKVDEVDPIATRWQRLGSERRERILTAMRSARPPRKEIEPPPTISQQWTSMVNDAGERLDGAWRDLNQPQAEQQHAIDEHEQVQHQLNNVGADEWLFTNRENLDDRLLRLVRSSRFALSHPRLAWGDATFAALLAGELLAGPILERLATALPDVDLGVLADRLRPLAEPLDPASQTDEVAKRKPDAADGPIGPRTWEPDVAIAVARKLDVTVRASIHRLQPRIVAAADATWQDDQLDAAGFDPSALVFSHPIDRLVARAMASSGTLSISRAKEGSELESPIEIRPVQFRWLSERSMWNWIEASPHDASVEEVSQALFGTTEKAFLLSASAPFFEVPIKEATALTPHRRLAIEAYNLMSGPASGGVTGIDALASSDVAESAALAQASRGAEMAGTDAAASASIDGERIAGVCQVQLESLAERIGGHGVSLDFSAAIARLEGRRASLPTATKVQAENLGLLFAQQRVILFKLATLLAKVGAGSGSDTANYLISRIAEIASVSDFVESAAARLADLAAEAGALPNEMATGLLNMAMERFGGIERVLEATKSKIVLGNEEIDFGVLRGQYDTLRNRALEVERRQATSELGPDEQRQLLDDIEFFELRVRTIQQVAQLTHTMEGLTDASGWSAEIVAIGDNLENDHTDLRLLREDIVRRFERFSAERAMYLRQLADPNFKPDPRTEYETTAAEVAKFKAELLALGNDEKIRASIQQAYDTLDDASGRLALLEFAKIIGITLITSGAGALATGVARGVQVGRLATAGITISTEAVVSSALIASTSDESFVDSFATEMVTGMAFFGAFKAFENVWSASQVGRQAAAMKGMGGVNRAIATGVEFSAQGVFAVGIQAATAEAQMLIKEGRSLSSDELAAILAQGTAMHIGSTIAHKVAAPVLARLERLGARGGALVARARRLRTLGKQVSKSGSLEESLELIALASDLARAEQQLYERQASEARSPEDSALSSPTVSDELAQSARESGVDYRDLAIETIMAQSTLEPIGGGLVGTTSEVAALVVKAEAAGLVPFQHVRPDGSRVVTLEGESGRIEIREIDRPETIGERGESLETQIEVNRLLRNPPPIQKHLDEFLGVSKSPEDKGAQADLATFFEGQDAQAKKKTRVISGHQSEGPYHWRYGANATPLDHGVVHVQYRVFLDPQGVSPVDIPAFKERVHEGIDRYYNYQHEVAGTGGQPARLHVEIEFVGTPAEAHTSIALYHGDGGANAAEWFADGEPTTHAHEVGHSAFGLVDEYVDAAAPRRADATKPGVMTDDSLMGDYWLKDVDAAGRPIPSPDTKLKPRHLKQIEELWNTRLFDRLRSLIGAKVQASPRAPSNQGGIRSKVEKRIAGEQTGFELLLDDATLSKVVAHGRSVGLDDETIEHIVFVGSRAAKRRSATSMMEEMTNYATVRDRGFPFRFRNRQDFDDFVSAASRTVGAVVSGTVRVQGSALRTPVAKDVDVAVIVGDRFDDLLVRSFQGAVRRDGVVVELSRDGIAALADEIREYPAQFNSRARTLEHAFRTGKVRDKDVGLKPARLALEARWGEIDLSVVKSEAGFDLKPHMDLSGEQRD